MHLQNASITSFCSITVLLWLYWYMNTYVSYTLQKWTRGAFKSENFHRYIKKVLSISRTEAIHFFPERWCSLLVRQDNKDTFIKLKQLDYLLCLFLAHKQYQEPASANWTKRTTTIDTFNKTVIVWPVEVVNMHQSMGKNTWQRNYTRHFRRGNSLEASPGWCFFYIRPPVLRDYITVNKVNKAVWNLYGKFLFCQ